VTVHLKEFDGRRGIEMQVKEGVLYIDGGAPRACFAFDVSILVRALEREMGVVILRDSRVAALAGE
jgi:hypothetical protein